MPKRAATVLSAAVLVGALMLGRAGAGEHTVEIKGLSFIPEELSVSVGDSVTWVNEDKDDHDLRSDRFDSPVLKKGATYSFTFNEPGEVEYRCQIHTYMQGRITVGGGGSASSPSPEPSTTTTTIPPSTTSTTRPPSGPLGLPVPAGVG
jgi:plastocyanin